MWALASTLTPRPLGRPPCTDRKPAQAAHGDHVAAIFKVVSTLTRPPARAENGLHGSGAQLGWGLKGSHGISTQERPLRTQRVSPLRSMP